MQTVVVICATLVGIISAAGDSPDLDYTFTSIGGSRGECIYRGSISTSNSNLCKSRSIYRDDFIQGGDLTWKILTDVCPNLIYAGCADPDWTDGPEHNMTRDLEWADSCYTCPQCPCHNGEVDKYYIKNYTTFDTSSYGFQVIQCVECSCNFFRQYYNDDLEDWVTIYARSCSVGSSYSGDIRQFDSPDELDHVQCPYTTPKPTPQPTGGCEDGAGNNFAPGEYFFYYDDDKCDTYCTCNSTDGLECQQGWDNILESDERMRMEFLNDCGSYLDDAWDDPSRWYKRLDYTCSDNYFSSSQSTTAFYQCPANGDCGGYNYTEGWNTTAWSYGTYDEEEMKITSELYNCVSCECNSDIYGGNSTSTVTCSTWYPYSVKNESMCGIKIEPEEDVYLNCSSDQNGNNQIGDIDSSTTSFTIGNQTFVNKYRELVDTTSCSVPEEYCGWEKWSNPKGFDPDVVCMDLVTGIPDWGCQDDDICIAAYGYDDLQESDTGFCSYNEISFTVKQFDCIDYEFKSETYQINFNKMCCGKAAGDYCNDQTPSETALDGGCPANSFIGSMSKELWECYLGDRGVTNTDYWKEMQCGVSLPDASNVKSRVCDLIENRWTYSTSCECKQYQMLEKAFGNSDYEDSLREQMQLDFDTSYATLALNLEEWNELYECGKTFECDIYDSVNTIKLSFLTVLFIAFVNYFL